MRAKEPIKKICEFCGCEFEAYTQVARYCSHDCNRKAYRKIKRKEVISLTASMTSQTKRERTKSDLSEREYISISDAAAIMGVSRWTIYRNVVQGIIPAKRLSKRTTIIRKKDIEALFDVIEPYEVLATGVHIVKPRTLLLLCKQKNMKRIMSKEEFQSVYERQQSSGLTIRDFCENEAYSASCFHYWKKKFGLSRAYTSNLNKTPDSTFIPLDLRHGSAHSSGPATDMTIEFPSGIKIHLDSHGNAELLLGLIHKLCGHVLPE